ncbi:CDP-glucose 4,6-dehydratase [Paenibacillus sp. Soil522]|uniref:CDP-glucose 4,6-dehydratase n=1 Tax=Paenibacillus sp. Soil522 TaxID=1736388 RepID=UPI0006F765FA|nr:CDP-glucose 4,6-dehydratase [Paenibacillus sp. Soil522]KRE46311.1 CDP-glucose 4,6-dehydratase [Paenibacillus sp. Soil522]
MIDSTFWKGKQVFVTGHTGFKGAWICLWLQAMGAEVTGYALQPSTSPSLYELCGLSSSMNSIIGDIRDRPKLQQAIMASNPDIVIHMAAQPIVRESYQYPVETYEINVLGTVYLLESIRHAVQLGAKIKAIVNVTSDKSYENKEWHWGYREDDTLGGYDPYSNSKACSEMVTSAYRNSFFNPSDYQTHGVSLASVRAGNVIGGGDWAPDRLVPDCIRSLMKGDKIIIRNSTAIRPWQHVLEPLYGYLLLAKSLYEKGPVYAQSWNFGPEDQDVRTVEWVVKELLSHWEGSFEIASSGGEQPHEAKLLKLDCSKAKAELSWYPKWRVEKAISLIVEWTRGFMADEDVKEICLKQIKQYEDTDACI